MAGYKVEICGINTSTLPSLNQKENDALIRKIKAGDTKAKETFIQGNLRLVLSVVQRFSNSNENMDDLFQIGCIGLIKALDNFDLNQGVAFSTYAVPMIIGEVRRHLRDYSSIRVSRSLRDTAYKAIYAKENLAKQTQREPTIAEIAAEIGIPREDIVVALDAIQTPISIYDPVYSDSGDTLYVLDQISDKKHKEENWVTHIALKDAIANLSDKERTIINKRYFECKTQMETAEEIGISQAQVSRLEKCALRSLKKFMS